MNVLSLFDGISAGQIAFERAGIKIDNYFASEINKDSITLTQHHYPNTIQLGDVKNVKGSDLPKIDWVIGGFCCQSFSMAGKQKGFNDDRGQLFYEYVRILNECQPTYFLAENVVMKKEYQDEISNKLGVKPVVINSSLVSAQNRKRLYWTNFKVEQPLDKYIVISDILDDQCNDEYEIKSNKFSLKNNYIQWDINNLGHNSQDQRAYYLNTKMCSLLSSAVNNPKVFLGSQKYRKITQLEAERLQTFPEGYTSLFSRSKALKLLGDSWTVDVIAHIIKEAYK